MVIGGDTKTRYFGLWTSLIFCFWRVSKGHTLARTIEEERQDDHEDDGDNDSEDETDCDSPREIRPLFTGAPAQRKSFDRCLEAAAAADQDPAPLRHSVQEWSLTMIRQDLPQYRFDSSVLSYCAMLAVNHSSQGWKQPGNFNSSLSGMIYCAQLWIFRKACLTVGDDPEQHLDDVLAKSCRPWMRQERSTTYGIILNWRLILFSVAKQEVSNNNATWSLDGSKVCYQGTAITMEQITEPFHQTLQTPRSLLFYVSKTPDKRSCSEGLYLGIFAGQEVKASAEEERRLQCITNTMHAMFERAQQTVQHTSRHLLCWVRSHCPDQPYRKPFQLVGRDSSLSKYVRVWKRSISTLVRLVALQFGMLSCPSSFHLMGPFFAVPREAWPGP